VVISRNRQNSASVSLVSFVHRRASGLWLHLQPRCGAVLSTASVRMDCTIFQCCQVTRWHPTMWLACVHTYLISLSLTPYLSFLVFITTLGFCLTGLFSTLATAKVTFPQISFENLLEIVANLHVFFLGRIVCQQILRSSVFDCVSFLFIFSVLMYELMQMKTLSVESIRCLKCKCNFIRL